MAAFKIGDKVRIPSDERILEAEIAEIDGNTVTLTHLVEQTYGKIYTGLHSIQKIQKSSKPIAQFCPYCGKQIKISPESE